MKAIVATGYGSPDVFTFKDVAKPKPKPNEILLKVKTSAATTADTMMRTGKPYFARLFLGLTKPNKPIPGTGFAGIVDEIGSSVTKFKKGDRVFGMTAFGFSANAEFTTVPEDGVVLHLDNHIDFTQAANFCDGHLTSYNFLKRLAKIQAGQKVLIIGASGALGTSGVQIAKYFGAIVHGVCSPKNAALVLSLGTDKVIHYTSTDYTQTNERYDVVYDSVGKSSFNKCKSILTENGTYYTPVLTLPALFQMIKTSIIGGKKAVFEASGTNPPDKLRVLLAEVYAIYKEGKLKTVIDRQFALEKLAEAHEYIDTGRKKGNVVMIHTQ